MHAVLLCVCVYSVLLVLMDTETENWTCVNLIGEFITCVLNHEQSQKCAVWVCVFLTSTTTSSTRACLNKLFLSLFLLYH